MAARPRYRGHTAKANSHAWGVLSPAPHRPKKASIGFVAFAAPVPCVMEGFPESPGIFVYVGFFSLRKREPD
jgi:hypothetical protein